MLSQHQPPLEQRPTELTTAGKTADTYSKSKQDDYAFNPQPLKPVFWTVCREPDLLTKTVLLGFPPPPPLHVKRCLSRSPSLPFKVHRYQNTVSSEKQRKGHHKQAMESPGHLPPPCLQPVLRRSSRSLEKRDHFANARSPDGPSSAPDQQTTCQVPAAQANGDFQHPRRNSTPSSEALGPRAGYDAQLLSLPQTLPHAKRQPGASVSSPHRQRQHLSLANETIHKVD